MHGSSYTNAHYRKLRRSPYYLIAILSVVLLVLMAIMIFALYSIGYQQQRMRLTELLQSRAIMVNVIREHLVKQDHRQSVSDIESVTISLLIEAQQRFQGFGKTGEYVMGTLEGERIRFLLHRRHGNEDTTFGVPLKSDFAEPMRRALKGDSGTIVGRDYRGATVLAAFAPIAGTSWGIVAKMDLSEIREPYINAAAFGLLGALFIIGIGSVIVLRFMNPLSAQIENERRYNRMLFDTSPIGLVLTRMNGTLIDVNPAFLKLVGYTEEEIYTRSYWDITPKKYLKDEEDQLKKLYSQGMYGPYEKEYVRKDGTMRDVRLSGRMIANDGERYIWSSVEDITQLKEDELALREAALVFDHTHEGIMITDAENRLIRVNSTFTKITGYRSDEVIGKDPGILQSGTHDKAFYQRMWKSISETGSWYGELNNRRKNGEYFATLQSITAVRNNKDEFLGYVSVFSDISKRKEYEEQLTHLANHDALTALPNRMYFHDNLTQAIHTAKRNRHKLAVFFLDLNSFKPINDTMGHKAGDKLLQAVAERLQKNVREEDTVARLGGDEFAIILRDISNSDAAVEVAKKLIGMISKPLFVGDTAVTPSISIGISIYPDHGEEGDMLLNRADHAMYRAKQESREFYAVFGDDEKDS